MAIMDSSNAFVPPVMYEDTSKPDSEKPDDRQRPGKKKPVPKRVYPGFNELPVLWFSAGQNEPETQPDQQAHGKKG